MNPVVSTNDYCSYYNVRLPLLSVFSGEENWPFKAGWVGPPQCSSRADFDPGQGLLDPIPAK